MEVAYTLLRSVGDVRHQTAVERDDSCRIGLVVSVLRGGPIVGKDAAA